MFDRSFFLLILMCFFCVGRGRFVFATKAQVNKILKSIGVTDYKDEKMKKSWHGFMTAIAQEVRKTLPKMNSGIDASSKALSTKQMKQLALYYSENSPIVAAAIRKAFDDMPAEQAIEMFYAMSKLKGDNIPVWIDNDFTRSCLTQILCELQQYKQEDVTFKEVFSYLKEKEEKFSENVERSLNSFSTLLVGGFASLFDGITTKGNGFFVAVFKSLAKAGLYCGIAYGTYMLLKPTILLSVIVVLFAGFISYLLLPILVAGCSCLCFLFVIMPLLFAGALITAAA